MALRAKRLRKFEAQVAKIASVTTFVSESDVNNFRNGKVLPNPVKLTHADVNLDRLRKNNYYVFGGALYTYQNVQALEYLNKTGKVYNIQSKFMVLIQ